MARRKRINGPLPVGAQFGRLTITGPSRKRDINKRKLYWCKCVCGKRVLVRGTFLRIGKTRSCGCLLKDILRQQLPDDRASINQIIINYQRNAVLRNLIWVLTFTQIRKIVTSNCFYCGRPPRNLQTTKLKSGGVKRFFYNGIDRIQNDKGYFMANVVPCCIICNHAKSNLAYAEFMAWIKDMIEYRKNK